MTRVEDENTRYFVDLDLETGMVLDWNYDNRHKLAAQTLAKPSHHRIFLTKGQYNKLVNKYRELTNRSRKRP